MKTIIRHGDLLLRQIEKLPKLKKSDTKILMKGSHGNNHEIDKGDVYFKQVDQFVFGYLKAKNTSLFHLEHSPKGVKIKNGIYELRKQVEFINKEMIPVID